MATHLQEAAARVAAAARRAKRYPQDPSSAHDLDGAIEDLAAVRATRALSDAIAGRALGAEARRRVLARVAANLASNGSAA